MKQRIQQLNRDNHLVIFLLLVTVIVLLTAITFPVHAQEVTLTPEATVTPGPISDPNVVGGFNASQVFMIFAVLYLIINGVIQALQAGNHGKLLEGYKAALERMDTRAAATDAYMRSSVQVKDAVNLFHSFVKVAANLNIPVVDDFLEEGDDFLDDVTDGKSDDAGQ